MIGGPSLVEALAAHLREQILTGRIAPGEKIVVRRLQGEFEISHIPIREALGRLEAEELVVNLPRRGAHAAPVSVEELIDIYDLRRIIEPEVAVRAAARLDDSAVAAIRAALERTDAAATDPVSEEFVVANRRFHEAMMAPAANPTIMKTLSRLWRMSDRYLRLGMNVPDSVEVACRQHHEIFDAMLSGEVRTIRAAVRGHLTPADAALASVDEARLRPPRRRSTA